jgi:hypothetical protein
MIRYIELFANIFIAVGVVITAIQLWLTKKQSITSFEDKVSDEYRQIIRAISAKALIGDELTDDEFDKDFNELYNYIDFSNEEVFLRQQRRIRKETWQYWCDGIKSNLQLPPMKKAWTIIKDKKPDSFNELRKLECDQFKSDPIDW